MLWTFLVVAGGCAEPSFEDREAELEAQAPTSCGVMHGICDFPATVDPLLACLHDNLAARTGAQAHEDSVERRVDYFTIDGDLIVLEAHYDDSLDVVWSERRCKSVGYHPAGDCRQVVPGDCDP